MSRTGALAAALLCCCSVTQSSAQTVISANGIVESTAGGFMFPDGTVQTTAAGGAPAPVADTGQKLCFDTSVPFLAVVPCLGTGEDGDKQAGADWPAPRFHDNGDGTVTDKLSGLIWLKDADCVVFGNLSWADALAAANSLSQGSCGLVDGSAAGDWRLPNIKELLSLVDYSQTDTPFLPTGHPFLNVAPGYWSSTTTASGENYQNAWVLILSGTPSPVGQAKDGASYFVWPVRGGI